MMSSRSTSLLLLCAALACGSLALALAGTAMKVTPKTYDGQIKSVRVEKCGLQPGTCEGTLLLTQAGGAEVELAIKPGTWIKRGDRLVTIDELSVGNYIKTEAIQLPGERVERITILSMP
jgi:hypothetical protein